MGGGGGPPFPDFLHTFEGGGGGPSKWYLGQSPYMISCINAPWAIPLGAPPGLVHLLGPYDEQLVSLPGLEILFQINFMAAMSGTYVSAI